MSDVLTILHRFRWPLAIALASLIAVFGGTVMGDLASESIAPFYANVVVPQARVTPGERLAEAPAVGYGEASDNGATSPVDLSYASATAAAGDTAEAAR